MVGNGFAAPRQPIEVRLHDAPFVQIDGQDFATGPKVASGDFGFAKVMFGADYLGFIGNPFVSDGAFALEYQRGVLTLLRTDAKGALVVPAPAPSGVVAHLTFALTPGEQPTTGAFVGGLSVVLDFDTGDGGTFYRRSETRARLEAERTLVATGAEGNRNGVGLGGARSDGLAVRLVEAGGLQDKRPLPGSDALRLWADFLSRNPSLRNFPAGTITILRPDAGFLATQ